MPILLLESLHREKQGKRLACRRTTVADACGGTSVQLTGESLVILETTTFRFGITIPSVTGESCRPKECVPGPRSLCLLQNDEGIRWNPEVDPPVSRGQITAEVADIVPAVDGGVAVEQFPPLPIRQSP